ncbi:MAG: SGNH/GDSL hydrolase family protein [Flavisolibacter sp.]
MQQKKKKILFFGDSITQMGVQANGYITRLSLLADQRNLSSHYDFFGAGIGGNKVYDLYLRMDEDVLSKNPDVVVIYIGVNDVWHKASYGTGTDPDKFEKFYNAIIKKLKAKNISIYLCTPAVIGEKTDYTNEQDGDLNKYSVIVRKVASDNNCGLIDLRQVFLDYLKKNNPKNLEKGILTTDRVHLNEMGNNLVAETIFSVLKLSEKN